MRTPISNRELPGIRGERVRAFRGELGRKRIYDSEGRVLGEIRYVTRRVRRPDGRYATEYGWLPPGGRRPLTQTQAVKSLVRTAMVPA